MATILIIDDNPTNRDTYDDILTSDGHSCLTASSGEEGLAKLTAAIVDVVLCDLKLPNLDGLGTMELAHEKHPGLPWVLITGHGNEETAVSAIKQGAFNYLTKPVDLSRLRATLESATRLASTTRENQALRKELGFDEALDRIIGTSAAIKNVKAMIRQVASADTTVLIEGESGTGKELIADAVHALSKRSSLPYIKINTAAIPHDLIESELFGHEKGSFTGAIQQKKGKFEACDNGSLFLDEIGEMPLDAQVKLLRVLQDGRFHRVGGTQELNTDVRLICATNRNLKEEVLENNFRMDLYYRLNVITIRVPPLRERREDIPVLTTFFIDRFNNKHGGNKTASDELLQVVRRQDWHGNVRELENTLEKCYILSLGSVIGAEHITSDNWEAPTSPTAVPSAHPQVPQASPASQDPATNSLNDIQTLIGLPLDEVERRHILATLDHCNGNKSKAARLLQIGLKTLYRKLEKYGTDAG